MGATIILAGNNGAECFKGVYDFKYLGRVLHRTEDYWPTVIRNIRRERQVWERLRKFLNQ